MIRRLALAALSVTLTYGVPTVVIAAPVVVMAADCKGNSRPCPDDPQDRNTEQLNNECTPGADQ